MVARRSLDPEAVGSSPTPPVVLHVPLPPNRANRRGHWAVLRKQDKAYQERARLHLLTQRSAKPSRPWLRCDIAAHVMTTRPQDLDNATARLKPVLDLLVRERWIVDDNPRVVQSLTVTTATGKPGVTLTVTP